MLSNATTDIDMFGVSLQKMPLRMGGAKGQSGSRGRTVLQELWRVAQVGR